MNDSRFPNFRFGGGWGRKKLRTEEPSSSFVGVPVSLNLDLCWRNVNGKHGMASTAFAYVKVREMRAVSKQPNRMQRDIK